MTEKAEYVLEKHLYDKHSAMVAHGHLSCWEGFHQIQNWKNGFKLGLETLIQRVMSQMCLVSKVSLLSTIWTVVRYKHTFKRSKISRVCVRGFNFNLVQTILERFCNFRIWRLQQFSGKFHQQKQLHLHRGHHSSFHVNLSITSVDDDKSSV